MANAGRPYLPPGQMGLDAKSPAGPTQGAINRMSTSVMPSPGPNPFPAVTGAAPEANDKDSDSIEDSSKPSAAMWENARQMGVIDAYAAANRGLVQAAYDTPTSTQQTAAAPNLYAQSFGAGRGPSESNLGLAPGA